MARRELADSIRVPSLRPFRATRVKRLRRSRSDGVCRTTVPASATTKARNTAGEPDLTSVGSRGRRSTDYASPCTLLLMRIRDVRPPASTIGRRDRIRPDRNAMPNRPCSISSLTSTMTRRSPRMLTTMRPPSTSSLPEPDARSVQRAPARLQVHLRALLGPVTFALYHSLFTPRSRVRPSLYMDRGGYIYTSVSCTLVSIHGRMGGTSIIFFIAIRNH